MPDVMGQALQYDRDDEQFLRRLGGAVIAQWNWLPPEVRDRLVKQAAKMADRENHAHLERNIELFIQARQSDVE